MKGKDVMLKVVLVADLAPLGKRNMAQEAADAGIVLSRHLEYSNLIESFRAETPGFSHGDEPGVIFV